MDSNFRRLVDTLEAIPPDRRISTSQIVSHLKVCGHAVTTRTVQRDLDALASAYGFECDNRSKPYGWRWPNKIKQFSGAGMGWPEALSFYLLREHVTALLPGSIRDHLTPYFEAADKKLQEHFASIPIKRWRDKIRVTSPGQPLGSPKVNRAVRDAVTEAILNDRQLEIVYRRPGAKKQQSWRIHPLGMVQYGPVFYVPARLFEYDDVLMLALHRIEKASALEKPAEAPEGFTLDKWLEDGALGFGGNRTIRLVVKFYGTAGNHLLESPLSSDQKVAPVRGEESAIRVTATVKETEQLRWWLLGFGDCVEVVSPKSLREDIAARHESAARRYIQNRK